MNWSAGNTWVFIIDFFVYFLIIAGISRAALRATSTLSDYVLGGRTLSPFVTAMGAGASDMSGWLLLGLPGAVYKNGLSEIWIVVGLFVGAYINWTLVAHRLRLITEKLGVETVSDYFRERFEDKGDILAIVSGLVTLVFFTVYIAAGFVGGALLFSSAFGISYVTGLLLSVVIIVGYAFVGGFLAVSWADTFQASIMFLALIIVPILATHHVGGVAQIFSKATLLKGAAFMHVTHGLTWIAILSLLAWGLGYFGQPHILVRFMAIRKPERLRAARNVCMTWMGISLIGAIFIGLSGLAFYGHNTLADPESVFLHLSRDLFPAVVGGFLLAAVLSAIMSTASAQLIVISSIIAQDFYKKKIRPEASEREFLIVGRFAVLVVMLVAFSFAYDPHSSILEIVGYAWAGMGATFGPIILISLFWKKMTRNGAVAGFIVGALLTVFWDFAKSYGGIFSFYSMIPGFIAASLAIWIVSALDGNKPSRKVLDALDDVHVTAGRSS